MSPVYLTGWYTGTNSGQGVSQGGSSMAYSVTKAAQWQLVKCLAMTVGPTIRVNTVLPGLLLTEWVRSTRLSSHSGRTLSNADQSVGTQVPGRADSKDEGDISPEARSVHGRLRGCVCDVGKEYQHDGHAHPG